jgi:hypothetical protein
MKEQSVSPITSPEKVARDDVSPVEIGKYYLKSEFGRIFPDDSVRIPIDRCLDELEGNEFWRLFEAISFAFRLNYVFRYVSNKGYSWKEEVWSIANLTLTGINPDINKVILSSGVNRSPDKFIDYLRAYFAEHPSDDPELLEQFRPDGRKVVYPKILLREEEGQILLLDGSNRVVKLMFQEVQQVTAFVGRKNGQDEKVRIGDSTFLMLRNLYQKGDPKLQKSTLDVVRNLIEISSDGASAVSDYWVRHARDEKLRKIGESLLNPKSRGK